MTVGRVEFPEDIGQWKTFGLAMQHNPLGRVCDDVLKRSNDPRSTQAGSKVLKFEGRVFLSHGFFVKGTRRGISFVVVATS